MSKLSSAMSSGKRGLEGLFIGQENAAMIEMAGLAGFGYVVLDAEHGSVWPSLPDLIRTARTGDLGVLVRVPLSQPAAMSQALDWGAEGILVPGARAITDVQLALQFCRYPPQGRRGLATMVPAAGYGWSQPGFLERSRAGVQVYIQVETREALNQVELWAQYEGVAGLFVGPADLSMALGDEGRPTARVEEAVERVAAACERVSRPWGIFTPNAWSRQRWLDRGAHLVATAVPMLLRQGVDNWRGVVQDG